jgi:tyrosyl-tRNA synthetase
LTKSTLCAFARIGRGKPAQHQSKLAKLIINDFHSAEAAFAAEDEFNRRFVKKEMPDEIEETQIAAGIYKLADLLVQTNLAASKGEAKRLIEQGGVKIGGRETRRTRKPILR